jgi:Protein of unknown function (DUF1573)
MKNIIFSIFLALLVACNNQPTDSPTNTNESQSTSVGANPETVQNNLAASPEVTTPVVTTSTTSTTPNEVKTSVPQPQATQRTAQTLEEPTATVSNGKGAKAEFDHINYEYGDIKQGDKVTHTFIIKNVGGAPLEIKDCKASCGCTQPEYSFEPIMPGQSSNIKVTFDSKTKEGNQKSTVTVITNGEKAAHQLYMTGVVVK